MKIGTKDILGIYIGTTPVDKLYMGSTPVYEKAGGESGESGETPTPTGYITAMKMSFDNQDLSYTSDLQDEVEQWYDAPFVHLYSTTDYKYGGGAIGSDRVGTERMGYMFGKLFNTASSQQEYTLDFWWKYPESYWDATSGGDWDFDEWGAGAEDTLLSFENYTLTGQDSDFDVPNYLGSLIIHIPDTKNGTYSILASVDNDKQGGSSKFAEVTASNAHYNVWNHTGLYRNASGLYLLSNGVIHLVTSDPELNVAPNTLKFGNDDLSDQFQGCLDEVRVCYGNPLANFNLNTMTYTVP